MTAQTNPYSTTDPDTLQVAIEKALQFAVYDQETAQIAAASARGQMAEIAKMRAALEMSAIQQKQKD